MLKELICFKWDNLYLEVALLAAVKTSCGMLKFSTLSTPLRVLLRRCWLVSPVDLTWPKASLVLPYDGKKTRPSSALEWGIVKISLTTFQRRGKKRTFFAWSFIFPITRQSESNSKTSQLVLHDSITWSGISQSRSNWYSLNSSVKESNSDGSSKGRILGYLWK